MTDISAHTIFTGVGPSGIGCALRAFAEAYGWAQEVRRTYARAGAGCLAAMLAEGPGA